jgi:hypothetical protein
VKIAAQTAKTKLKTRMFSPDMSEAFPIDGPLPKPEEPVNDAENLRYQPLWNERLRL